MIFEKSFFGRGELGIQSYAPWQVPDYFLIRPIVEEFVNEFIAKIPGDLTVYDKEIHEDVMGYSQRQRLAETRVLSERKAVRLVGEQIILELTQAMVREVASEGITTERMFRRISANLFIKEAEVQVRN